jgi:hypothetical protein
VNNRPAWAGCDRRLKIRVASNPSFRRKSCLGPNRRKWLCAHSCFLEEVASKLPTNQPPLGRIPTRANRYPDLELHRRPAHQIWARIGDSARSHVSDAEPLPRSKGHSPSGDQFADRLFGAAAECLFLLRGIKTGIRIHGTDRVLLLRNDARTSIHQLQFWAFRVDRRYLTALDVELQQGRLRQGWRWDNKQDLRAMQVDAGNSNVAASIEGTFRNPSRFWNISNLHDDIDHLLSLPAENLESTSPVVDSWHQNVEDLVKETGVRGNLFATAQKHFSNSDWEYLLVDVLQRLNPA